MSHQESADAETTKKLDNVLKVTQNNDTKIIKLLLLGTGESGKSTIFKQMQILYVDNGFTEFEKNVFRPVVRKNIVDSIQTLIMGADRFNLRFQDKNSNDIARWLLRLDPLANDFWNDDIVPRVRHLWEREPAITQAYSNRSKLQLIDSAAYFFKPENLNRIADPNYIPNKDDILRARLRTSGIVEKVFNIQGNLFKFLDVGGQRNERRKWIHCFQDVTAVIFVTAIQEYDQFLYEDEKENRLLESINVFNQIINNICFARSTIILFLNKMDLFAEKIKYVPLSVCFNDIDGDSNKGVDEASDFIRDKFTVCSQDKKRLIFAHKTCATDTKNVEKVFEACKVTILKISLDRIGFT